MSSNDIIHVPRDLLNELEQDHPNDISSLSEEPRGNAESSNSNTEKTTRWAVNAYNNWRLARQSGAKEVIPDLTSGSVDELNHWMSLFVRECRQRDGREYKHQNLYAMVCGISRYIRKERPSLNILDDVGMKDFKASLYEVMKRLQSKQANLYSVQVSKITRKQWDFLWEEGYLGESNPTSLLYAVYALFISVTGVSSALQLRSMTTRNIQVTKDPNSDKYITTYYPIPSVSKPDRAAIRCTDDGTQSRSFGRLLQLYLSRLPPFFPDLWVRPSPNSDTTEWYSKQPLGQNILRTTVKSLCQVANFVGNFSNQSLGRDLLSWDHYEIDHLMQMATGSREPAQRETTQGQRITVPTPHIKREITGEIISSVTVNTHLPAAKRLKVEGNQTEVNDPCPLNRDESINMPPRRQPSNTPPHIFLPSSDSPPHISSQSRITIPSPPHSEFGDTHQLYNNHSTHFHNQSDASENMQYQAPATVPSQSENIEMKENMRVGHELRDVHVNIPDHINQCLGLFKDCTIQNVTINIYLDKDKQGNTQ